MRISIIAAMDEKRGIGKNKKLLFKIPEDFKRMSKLTNGHPLIMGRKTFESIGRVLPNRTNIVITRNADRVKSLDFYTPEVIITPLMDEAIERANASLGSDEIFIFGGGEIFKEAMERSLVDKLYLTLVEGDYNADTFFPPYTQFKKVVFEKKGEGGGYKYRFLELERV